MRRVGRRLPVAQRGQHARRGLLGGGHVRLVERVDADGGAGDRGRELPAEELAAQPFAGRDDQVDDRMAGGRQRVELRVGARSPVARRVMREADEDAIVAVDARRRERLADDGHDAVAVLAGALGDELLDPVAEALERRLDDQGQLVAAAAGQRAERRAQHDAGVAGVRPSTGRRHPRRLVQQRVEVEAEQGGGRQPDVGQRRVAAADVGRVEEHRPEGVAVRDRLDRGVGVGDGHEVIALVLVADVVVAGVLERPEVRQEGQRLGRRARLGGDDVAAGLGAEGRGRQRDRLRIGRVEDADRHGPSPIG